MRDILSYLKLWFFLCGKWDYGLSLYMDFLVFTQSLILRVATSGFEVRNRFIKVYEDPVLFSIGIVIVG